MNALQEAHEREIGACMANVSPLREQLDLQKASLSALQSQLAAAKEELLVASVERDHLNSEFSQSKEKAKSATHQHEAIETLRSKVSNGS